MVIPRAASYFDNAATTPVDPRVLTEMLPYFSEDFGNAHSLHGFGKRAEAAVERARQRLATFLGAEDSAQIYFTSGATEANNWVLRAFPNAAISPFEHSSLHETAHAVGAKFLANRGLVLEPPAKDIDLVSVMAVNNEIGTQWDASQFVAPDWRLHSDLTQAAGKLPVSVECLDFASLSGHKFYGPKGIGLLYCRETPPDALLTGGEQEYGFRAGTLNVPGIVGLAVAAAIAQDELEINLAHARELRSTILHGLRNCTDMMVNGGENASPFILSLSFLGVEGETMVVEMDRLGFAISSGAACSSRSTQPSHVLTALGLSENWLRGTIRISTGKYNDGENCEKLCVLLLAEVEKLRTMQ